MRLKQACAVVLAAGEGKRMKSKNPKVLCEVLFKPMLEWVLTSCDQVGLQKICVVTGHKKEQVEEITKTRYENAFQEEQNGTGHAVMCAEGFLKQNIDCDVAILCGDAPFMDSKTLVDSHKYHCEKGNSVTVISADLDNPFGYGRIVKQYGRITSIVEQKDADEDQKLIKEVNSGAYWFKCKDLLEILKEIKPDNSQGEYYLTDAIKLLLASGKRVSSYKAETPDVVLGANDRKSLYALNAIARDSVIEKHMENGVEFVCTDGIIIGPDVEIGAGTLILPGTILKGKSKIGEDCVIGPNSLLQDSQIGDRTELNQTQVYQSIIHEEVTIGPFTQIRPNCEIGYKAHIGNFVEIKNSTIGAGTAVAHLTYVGDSDFGKNINVGCGVVTVNYDGVKKYRATVDDGAFIGCNTNLISPVHIGEDAYTAAGSTISKDVPAGALGIERGQQVNKEGFAKRKLAGRKKKV